MKIDEDDFAILSVDESEWMVVLDRNFKSKRDAKNYITVLVLNVNRR